MMAAKRNEGIVERVTVKTIAEMANVSIGTVDRALNGRGRINPDTKERILKIAKMMNYTPNRTAQALKRQRQIRIGIVMADTPIQFCDHLRHGIEDALGEMTITGSSASSCFPIPCPRGIRWRSFPASNPSTSTRF